MMSTMGRKPVIAAPTATAVNPASEIGVSRIRSGPNSLTKPVRTLNGWPASAMSSPRMKTRESRRSSSARASRMASAKVSSRMAVATSGINVLAHFVNVWVRSGERELHSLVDVGLHFGVNPIEGGAISEILRREMIGQQFNRIAVGLPLLFFLFGAIVFAADIADVMAHIAIGIDEKERRAFAVACSIDQAGGRAMDCAHVLSIDALGRHAERRAAREDIAGSGFRVVRVFVVEIVLANVDYGQLPQRREIHHFVEQPLTERTLAEETNHDLAG